MNFYLSKNDVNVPSKCNKQKKKKKKIKKLIFVGFLKVNDEKSRMNCIRIRLSKERLRRSGSVTKVSDPDRKIPPKCAFISNFSVVKKALADASDI